MTELSPGQFQHGDQLVIMGTGFGNGVVKGNGYTSSAVPDVWDDFEDGFEPYWMRNGANTRELEVVRNEQSRHQFSQGTAHLNFTKGTDGDGYLTAQDHVSRKWIVQYRFFLDLNWDWGHDVFGSDDQYLSNIKTCRFWNPADVLENLPVTIMGWEHRLGWVVENVSPDQFGFFLDNFTRHMTRGEWHVLEFVFSDSSDNDAADGSLQISFDGELVVDETGLITRNETDFKRPFIVGFSEVWGPNMRLGETYDGDNDFHMDDVFVNDSWARVVVADAPIYANAQRREIQIPTIWDDNSIAFDVNQGVFVDGDSLYLFVFDSNGIANPIGFPIESTILGDVNLDGAVDLLDVAPFVELVTNGEFQAEADINQDGAVDLLDVQPFVDLLVG